MWPRITPCYSADKKLKSHECLLTFKDFLECTLTQLHCCLLRRCCCHPRQLSMSHSTPHPHSKEHDEHNPFKSSATFLNSYFRITFRINPNALCQARKTAKLNWTTATLTSIQFPLISIFTIRFKDISLRFIIIATKINLRPMFNNIPRNDLFLCTGLSSSVTERRRDGSFYHSPSTLSIVILSSSSGVLQQNLVNLPLFVRSPRLLNEWPLTGVDYHPGLVFCNDTTCVYQPPSSCSSSTVLCYPNPGIDYWLDGFLWQHPNTMNESRSNSIILNSRVRSSINNLKLN